MRQRVGIVFQQFNLFPHLTAIDNLTLAARRVRRLRRRDSEARARELLALLTSGAIRGAGPGVLFRDARGDVYQVALESDERSLDDAGCFGRMRRDAFDCDGRGSFD